MKSIFILGSPRTGTTALNKLFLVLLSIEARPESAKELSCLLTGEENDNVDPIIRGIARGIKYLPIYEPLRGLGTEVPDDIRDLPILSKESLHVNVIESLVTLDLTRELSFLLLKEVSGPGRLQLFSEYAERFGGKTILTERHPILILNSLKQQRWDQGLTPIREVLSQEDGSILQTRLDDWEKFNLENDRLFNKKADLSSWLDRNIERWISENTVALDFASAHKSEVIMVRHYDLLKDPRKVIQNLCNFCDIPISDEVMNAAQKFIRPQFSPSVLSTDDREEIKTRTQDLWTRILSFDHAA